MNWDKLEISLLVGGFLIAIGGKELNVPILISIGMGLVALVIALIGVEAIITRKMKWGITQHYSETYQGIAAISLGLIMLTAGIGLIALVIAQALHQENSLFEMIFSRPGFILLLVGGVMSLRGLAGVIGALEWQKTALSRFSGMLERIAMFVLLLLGIILLTLGALDIVAPAAFQWLVTFIWQVLLHLIGIQ